MKTPEQMADEHVIEKYPPLREESEPENYLNVMIWERKTSFLAGYKAGQEHPFQFQAKMWIDPIGPQNRWISVKERLPEEGEEVLVFGQYLNDIPKVLGVRSRYKGDQDWKYTWEGSDEWVYREDDVTHWMPLPEAPKGEK